MTVVVVVVGVAPVGNIQRVCRCRFLPYFATSTFVGLLRPWRIICMRRTESENRNVIPSGKHAEVTDGKPHSSRDVVSRNIRRARRPPLRPQASPLAEELAPIAIPGGTILRIPPDDENGPSPALGALSLRPPLGSFEPSSDSEADSRPGRGPIGWSNPRKIGR